MAGDEESGADLAGLIHRSESVGKNLREGRPGASAAGDRPGPRVVPPRDREQAALQLASSLTGAVAQFLLDAEGQALSRAERVRASALADLERQRANVESLMGRFAERLQQQEDGLSSLRKELEPALATLQRYEWYAEAIQSLSERQAHHDALLGQLREVVGRLAAAVASMADPPRVSV